MDKEDLKYIEAGILGCSESELTEDLSQEVDSEGNPLTKEQVEFFRNSKIRDNRGRLLVCYHGSKSHFTTFDKSKIKSGGWYGKGFYFTRSQEIADYYSEGYILTCYLNMINPFYADSSFTSKEEYHNRCNKLCELIGLTMEEIDKRDEECKYIGDPYYKVLLYLEHTKSTKDINDYVKELGYDGVIGLSPEDDSLEEFIILEPNQVKSIDNKNPSDKDDINEELLYHGQDDDDMYDRENTLTWYTTSENYAKQYGQKIFTKDIDLSKYNLLDIGEINDDVFDNDGNYTKEFKQFCKKIEMTPKQLEKYLKQFGWYPKYLNFIFDITSEYPFYRLLIDLGYDGVKAKEGGYDTYGLMKSELNENISNKTYTFPNLQQAIDFFWKDRNVKIETVPIKKLVDDNNLLNDWDLQSYHQRQWDNKKASEFSIDKNKAMMWRLSEVPYAVRKKDGRLELGDGRHRTRALYNDGYEYVTLPVITESKLNENKGKKHKYFAVSENDSEYYDTKANALKDLVNFGKDVEVVLYSLKNVEDIDELSSEDELGHYINGKLVKSKTTLKTTPKIKESLLQEGKQDIENFKKWIENNEDSNARLMSDGNKEAFVNNWATEFNNIRQNLKSPYNDFYYWIKLNDWNAFTKFMQEQRNKKDAKQKEKDGAKLIYSDNDWKVYEITTYEASVKYGANTKWCISGSKRWSNGENGRGYWDDYTSKGVKFYFFINRDTKYAIAIYPNGTDFEIFDAQDNSIAYIPNAPIIDEIKVDYYSHNEDRLMLNLIKTGQLPHVCSILSSYLWKCNYYTDIYTKSDFDAFLHAIEENVNADYVKWLAVYDGLKDEEWYKQETGEEYEDEWMGDTTNYIYINFLDGYATLDDALTKDNPKFYYDESEYFINDLYECDILCCKDWVGVWLHIDKYIKDETDLINFIKKDIRDNWNYEDFEKVGLSKEYLLDIDDDYYEEDLDESLDEFDDEVGIVYHGGIEKSLHKDFKSILWFTEDYDYALDFGENIFICNLNLKNTFIVGNTDGYIRGLIPTQFSMDFTRLANNLRVTPKELLKCNPEAKNIYSIVRTKAFKELCIKNGYDSVETEEFGHVCFGVFNLDQVDIVDTDFEDESTLETLSPMDESIIPNLRDIK